VALDAVLARFIERSPVTVLAQLSLQRAFEADWIDALFDAHRQRQYKRELLFSSVVDLMSLVALGLQPSVHAAAQAKKDLPVSLAALYDKINHTEPALGRALVAGCAERLAPMVSELRGDGPATLPGYRIRILDGNHLAATDKRLKPLRPFRGSARPGHSLVVYDPDLGLVLDLIPCEDAHTQERTLVPQVLLTARPGEVWIADRNFSTNAILSGWHQRGAAFVVREHSVSPSPKQTGQMRKVGASDTGVVYEQAVQIVTYVGETICLRRIEVHLNDPTDAGDAVIRILTNLPVSVDAKTVAGLYRRRWKIEGMFQWLESVLQSEISTLGYPRAALFAFAVAVLGYNVLSLVHTAIERAHEFTPEDEAEISLYHIAVAIRASHGGMMIAVPAEVWAGYDHLSPRQTTRLMLRIASKVDTASVRKHPRGPKKKTRKGYAPGDIARSCVATARVLKTGRLTP
jgi:IS4 transposase